MLRQDNGVIEVNNPLGQSPWLFLGTISAVLFYRQGEHNSRSKWHHFASRLLQNPHYGTVGLQEKATAAIDIYVFNWVRINAPA